VGRSDGMGTGARELLAQRGEDAGDNPPNPPPPPPPTPPTKKKNKKKLNPQKRNKRSTELRGRTERP